MHFFPSYLWLGRDALLHSNLITPRLLLFFPSSVKALYFFPPKPHSNRVFWNCLAFLRLYHIFLNICLIFFFFFLFPFLLDLHFLELVFCIWMFDALWHLPLSWFSEFCFQISVCLSFFFFFLSLSYLRAVMCPFSSYSLMIYNLNVSSGPGTVLHCCVYIGYANPE